MVFLQLLNQNEIVSTDTINFAKPQNQFEYNLMISKQLYPSYDFVASYVNEDGEIVADVLTSEVEDDEKVKFC